MGSYCEDCGCALRGGRCPNCDEEQVIYEDQVMSLSEEERKNYYPDGFSDGFMEKVDEQRRRNFSGYRK